MYRLQLDEQDAVASLNDLADQTAHAILYSSQDLEGIVLGGLAGYYLLSDALNMLLKNTRLEAIVTERDVIVISITPQVQPQQSNQGEVNMEGKGKLLAGFLAAVGGLFGGDVSAQNEDADITQLEEIVVVGVRGSILSAIEEKRNSAQIVDSIQSEDLGRFPDNNLALSLQRLPGVSIERSSTGLNQLITVRGLSSQFTQVLLNGMVPGTGGGGRAGKTDVAFLDGDDGRAFDFGLLPPELVSTATVAKSPRASDPEGAVGALVDLKTPNPFDLAEISSAVSLMGNWGEESGGDPSLSGFFSRQVNDQFAFLVGGTYSELQTQSSTVGFGSFQSVASRLDDQTGVSDDVLNAVGPSNASYVVRDVETESTSLMATLAFRPSERATIRLDGLYSESVGNDFFLVSRYDLSSSLSTPSGAQVEDGVLTSASFEDIRRAQYEARSDVIDDTLEQITLSGEFDVSNNWVIQPFVGYSRRERARPFDSTNFTASGGGADFDYSIADGYDGFSSTQVDFSSTPELFVLSNVLTSASSGYSEQSSYELRVARNFDDGFLTRLSFGIRSDDREAYSTEPFRGALNFAAEPTLDLVSNFTYTEFLAQGPAEVFGGNPLDIAAELLNGQDILDPDFDILDTELSGIVISNADEDLLATSRVTEKVLAAYLEADIEVGNLSANAGLRFVQTDVDANGSASSPEGGVEPISRSGDYNEVLPAVNVRYGVADDLFLRATYSKALSRPSLRDLSPRETINFNTLTGTLGNPDLDPFTVDQMDLGIEWYPLEEVLLGFTYFEKDFSSIVGTQLVLLERDVATTSGAAELQTIEFQQPINSGAAKLDGMEIFAQTRFFFLPDALQNFGMLVNFTSLDSSVSGTESLGDVAIPFPNLSESSYNASLYYDDGIFDARLNYAWREGFVRDAIDPTFATRQDDFGQLDLTANYQLTDNVSLTFQAVNLTDEALNFSSGLEEVPLTTTSLERRATFGVRARF